MKHIRQLAFACLFAAFAPASAQNSAPGEIETINSAERPQSESAPPPGPITATSGAWRLSPTRAQDLAIDSDADIPPLLATGHFASAIALWEPQLSPDGTAMTFFERTGEKVRLRTIDPRTGEAIDSIAFAPGSFVDWLRWIDNDRMLVNVWTATVRGPYVLRFSKLMIAYPREGRFEFLVDEQRSFNGGDVIHIDEAGEYALIAHRGDGRFWYPSVYRYELKRGGEITKIEDPIKGVTSWLADESGVVRLAIGWWKGRLNIYYRSDQSEQLERIARLRPGDEESYFDAIAVISGSDRGYVLDEGESGRVGLRVYDYGRREVVETVYEHPEWDVEAAFLRDGKPFAVFYTDDRQRVIWFDDDYRATFEELQSALGNRDVRVISRSKDTDRMLVWAGNEADPGILYFYDRPTQEMVEVSKYRPPLDPDALAKPQAITYMARDGTPIRAYLTLPKGREAKDLPLIIHPHGGPFGIRDELRYDDQVQFLANRGYAVLQPNFRGSGGYGNAFYELGDGEVGRGMQNDLDDAMDWAVREGIADPQRICVVGGSYGGYAALWAVIRNPERYRCAASWAGVTDWDRMLRYDRGYLTREASRRWQAKIEGDDREFDLRDVSPYRLARNLSRPVLLAHGTRDARVPFSQFEQMRDAADNASGLLTTLVIEDEGHSFTNAANEQQWYDALDAFLAEHNPADPAPVAEAAAQTARGGM